MNSSNDLAIPEADWGISFLSKACLIISRLTIQYFAKEDNVVYLKNEVKSLIIRG